MSLVPAKPAFQFRGYAFAALCLSALALSGCVTSETGELATTLDRDQGSSENIGSLSDVISSNANDPEAYIISHIGWGTDHRARWSEIAQRGTEDGAREVRSTYGNIQIAFGANYRLGGKNRTMAHEDLILRRAKFELDGRVIVDDGRILPEELR